MSNIDDFTNIQQQLAASIKPLTATVKDWNIIRSTLVELTSVQKSIKMCTLQSSVKSLATTAEYWDIAKGRLSEFTSIQKSLKEYKLQTSSKEMSQILHSALPRTNDSMMSVSKALHLSSVLKDYNTTSIVKLLQELQRTQISGMPIINHNFISITRSYSEILKNLNNLDIDLSEMLSNAYEEYEEINDTEVIEDDFDSSEEVMEALQEQASNPIGFQERVANWSEAKFKKYFIVLSFVMFIWSNFVQPYFQDIIGQPVMIYVVSKVKDLPNKAGGIIDELKKDMEAMITEDVPYYYKVKYTDEKGVEKEGYIAKKNLKFIKTTELEEEENVIEDSLH